MFRMVRHQLAPELKWILASRMGKLVHKAFEIESILIVVHAAPENAAECAGSAWAWSMSRFGNRVTESAFRPARVEALKHEGILTVLQALRRHKGDNGTGPKCGMCKAVDVIVSRRMRRPTSPA